MSGVADLKTWSLLKGTVDSIAGTAITETPNFGVKAQVNFSFEKRLMQKMVEESDALLIELTRCVKDNRKDEAHSLRAKVAHNSKNINRIREMYS